MNRINLASIFGITAAAMNILIWIFMILWSVYSLNNMDINFYVTMFVGMVFPSILAVFSSFKKNWAFMGVAFISSLPVGIYLFFGGNGIIKLSVLPPILLLLSTILMINAKKI